MMLACARSPLRRPLPRAAFYVTLDGLAAGRPRAPERLCAGDGGGVLTVDAAASSRATRRLVLRRAFSIAWSDVRVLGCCCERGRNQATQSC
eukprot:4613475-Pleurochrysis_carterae.AAC.2